MPHRHDQPTRTQPAAPQPPHAPSAATPLDVKTLLITAAASALAAFICSKVWAPGTLASAAFTPVAVSLFREALRKPTEVVTAALPGTLPLARRGASGPYGAGPVPPMGTDPTRTGRSRPLSDADATQVHRAVPPGEQPTRVSLATAQAFGDVPPATIHAVARRNRRRWQIAIGTGLLGFVIAALLITVPEVIAGKSNTTIFQSGRNTPAKKSAPATTTTVVQQVTTAPAETVTQTTEAAPTTTTTETQTVTEEAAPTTTATTPSTTATTPATTATTPDAAATPEATTP